MKNSVKVALAIGFLVVGSGIALTFCTSKSDKQDNPVDTTKVETTQNPPDTTAQESAKDTTNQQ